MPPSEAQCHQCTKPNSRAGRIRYSPLAALGLRAGLAGLRFGDSSLCNFGGMLSMRAMIRLASSKSRFSAMTTKPFARPAPPSKGDLTPDMIFLAVGRALSEWETTEQIFARLYGIIVAPDDPFPYPAERAYGSIATARGRKEMIAEAAKALFSRHPHPTLPKQLDAVLKAYSDAGAWRNEIAHGLVTFTRLTHDAKGYSPEYVLVPSMWNSNKRDVLHEPAYTYSAAQIDSFRTQLKPFRIQAGEAARELRAHVRSSREKHRERLARRKRPQPPPNPEVDERPPQSSPR